MTDPTLQQSPLHSHRRARSGACRTTRRQFAAAGATYREVELPGILDRNVVPCEIARGRAFVGVGRVAELPLLHDVARVREGEAHRAIRHRYGKPFDGFALTRWMPDRTRDGDGTWLYLDRYWCEEQRVADDLKRLMAVPPLDIDGLMVAIIGTSLFAVASVVLAIFHSALVAAGLFAAALRAVLLFAVVGAITGGAKQIV